MNLINDLYGYANVLAGNGPTLHQLFFLVPAAILILPALARAMKG